VSPTPRAAALLAVIALATIAIGPAAAAIAALALAGATLADALAVRARPHRPAARCASASPPRRCSRSTRARATAG